MYKLFKLFSHVRPTAYPRITEAVNAHLEGMKPLFDQASINVIELNAHSQSREDSQIIVSIDEKHRLEEIVFFRQLIQERSS